MTREGAESEKKRRIARRGLQEVRREARDTLDTMQPPIEGGLDVKRSLQSIVKTSDEALYASKLETEVNPPEQPARFPVVRIRVRNITRFASNGTTLMRNVDATAVITPDEWDDAPLSSVGFGTEGVPDGHTWRKLYVKLKTNLGADSGINALVYLTRTRWTGSATKVRVVLMNSEKETRAVYFESAGARISGNPLCLAEKLDRGLHVMPPQHCLEGRKTVGGTTRQRVSLIGWGYLEDAGLLEKAPGFAARIGSDLIDEYHPTLVGPYRMAFGEGFDEPGGYGIDRYPEWNTTANGLAFAEARMDVVHRHPVFRTHEGGLPLSVSCVHTLHPVNTYTIPGFEYEPRHDPCLYEHTLARWKKHDDEHLMRSVIDAHCLAPWDPWARDVLRFIANDVYMGHALNIESTREGSWYESRIALDHGGEPQYEFYSAGNLYAWPIAYKLERTDPFTMASWTSRGFSHGAWAIWSASKWWRGYLVDLNVYANAYLHCANEIGLVLGCPEINPITGHPEPQSTLEERDPPWSLTGYVAQGISTYFAHDSIARIGQRLQATTGAFETNELARRLFGLNRRAYEYLPPHLGKAFEIRRTYAEGKEAAGKVPWYHLYRGETKPVCDTPEEFLPAIEALYDSGDYTNRTTAVSLMNSAPRSIWGPYV